MNWSDIFKIWNYATSLDPITRREISRSIEGAGVTDANAIPDIRSDGGYLSANRGNIVRLRDSTDFIDLSSVTNRQSRYKEYDRLRNVPEVETALTVFADESCVTGDTLIATPFGYFKIEELAQEKSPTDEFLVYCYDFKKEDYTLGWAYHPRFVKRAPTVKFILNNGLHFSCTTDHLVLLRNGKWVRAGSLACNDELMPFYRLRANTENKQRQNYFARIFTHTDGWKTERQFIDEWRRGYKQKNQERLSKIMRLIQGGLNTKQISEIMKRVWGTLDENLRNEGFSYKEVSSLNKNYPDKCRVIHKIDNGEQDVFDLSVKEHENFATNSIIMHNCQVGENGHIFRIDCKDKNIKEELEFLFFHPNMLNIDRKMFNIAKNLYLHGDHFMELVIDPEEPKGGILKVQNLPADSVYRIETIKGKILEFQQSKEGPDYQSLARVEVTKATPADLAQATAIRFMPKQIVHFRIGEDRQQYYPYGVSLIDAARGPAHNLRLMEDAMLVYRLIRAPERRVFYIDVGGMPPFKMEAFMDRMRDMLRKKKTFNPKGGSAGASPVEERFTMPSQDEDIWIPLRPNSNTRVETLPGACLALNTIIPLLDGRELTLSEIIKEFEAGKKLWAYSCNPKNGEPAPGLISWAGITRKNTQVVKIHLDNGDSVVCTPDHKFPVIGKGDIQAKDLAIGESLIPFNTREKKISSNRNEYLQVYNNATKKWEFVHRLVARSVENTQYEQTMLWDNKFEGEELNCIHHKNFNRFDNTPENLAWMNWTDHVLYHTTVPRNCGDKISKSLVKFHNNLSEEEKKLRNERLKGMSKSGKEQLGLKLLNPEFHAEFRKKQCEGWEKAKVENPDLHTARGKKISERNKIFWSNPENKKSVFAKQTVKYPQKMFDKFVELVKDNLLVENIIIEINNSTEFIDAFVEANNHIVRNVDFAKGISVDHVKKMVKQYGYKNINQLRKSIGTHRLNLNSSKKYGRPEIGYPKEVMDKVVVWLSKDIPVNDIINNINAEYLPLLKTKRPELAKFTLNHFNKMIRSFGYDGLSHLRSQFSCYNHKVVKVEWLDEKIDTGTLTIDAKHELHGYHNFAINGIFIKNSNLGEIDDALYFRNKLFIAMNFPKNYMAQEDAQITKVTISSVDVKFARLIERLQMSLADGMMEIAIRHLDLRGFPSNLYEDLQIKFTPPSHWRELSENEVIQTRYDRAMAIKGSMLFADLDILTKILKVPEDEAKEIVARATAQQIQQMKLQIVAQNPQLLGVAIQQPAGNEMGTTQEGPNPTLTGEEQLPGTEPAPEQPEQNFMSSGKEVNQTYGKPQSPEGQKLPEPEEKDIMKYDLDIEDFSKEIDEEEIDEIELDS